MVIVMARSPKQVHTQVEVGAISIPFIIGINPVEKHNDDAKQAYFSSNEWNAAADIIKTEVQIECLRKYAAAEAIPKA